MPGLCWAATLEVCHECRYTTLQEALEAASPGDTLEVGPGTYTGNLGISKPVSIRGTPGEVVLVPQLAILPTLQVTAGDVALEGLTFANGTTGLEVFLSDNVSVTECSFRDSLVALRVEESTGVNLSRLEIDGCAVGASVVGSSRVAFTDSLLEGEDTGIEASMARECLFSGLTLKGFQKGMVFSAGEGNRVESTVFEGSADSPVFFTAVGETGAEVVGCVMDGGGLFAREVASMGDLYVIDGAFNISGANYELSFDVREAPEDFNLAGRPFALGFNPAPGEDAWAAVTILVELPQGRVNLSTLGLYRRDRDRMEVVLPAAVELGTGRVEGLIKENGTYYIGAEAAREEAAGEGTELPPGGNRYVGLAVLVLAAALVGIYYWWVAARGRDRR